MSAKLPTVSKDDVQLVPAISIRKNKFMLLQGKVCKVQKWQTSTTGKHGGAKIHFFAFDVFTGKKVEEIFNSHDNVTMPEAEKFVITVRKIKEGGVLDAKFDGAPVTSMKIPAAGRLRDEITHALKTNAECQVECMATYGQRGCCSVVGVTSANNTRDNSDDEREHSASGDSSADDVVRDENETDTVESRHESDSISDE